MSELAGQTKIINRKENYTINQHYLTGAAGQFWSPKLEMGWSL